MSSTETELTPANSSDGKSENIDTTLAVQQKPIKKVKSKKDLKNDPSRFETPGVNFNAKLIGVDDIESARGDKMCQESMHRLKIAVKSSGQHKQKIIINVSLDGIRIIDVRTQATNHTHPVHRISFISRDTTDARAFGYVYGIGEGKHKFFAIKTEKAAEALVLTLRDLFQAVYEMKKQQVEQAKHKIEEPTEKAEEAKETQEPVYQVPTNGQPVENDADPTYQVPTNNAPVKEEAAPAMDLLNLESELESMEKRIEQIDTMEELFKELEAPPSTKPSSPTNKPSNWASDLAGLTSQAPTQPTQPMFSMGGSPFPASQLAFPGQPMAGQPMPGQPMPGQPMPGQPMPGVAPHAGFGLPAPPGSAAGAQFGQANPFQQAMPTVPPRTGVVFPASPGGFPGTPFPGAPQPGFPPTGAPPSFPGAQPSVMVTPASDPFGSDPFTGEQTAFEESILTPARKEPLAEQPSPTSQKKSAFDDLVSIGDKQAVNRSPKDMFSDLSSVPKKSLNELKVDKAPSPKPASPTGFQASNMDDSSPFGATVSPSVSADPFKSQSPMGDPFADDPFALSNTANDPFAPSNTANDPFAPPSTSQVMSTTNMQDPAQSFPSTQSSLQSDLFSSGNVGDDEYNIPLPEGPPPPLPPDVVSDRVNICPALPPRPPVGTAHTPPLPPRPRSSSSVSSTGSTASESRSASQQQTPPLPPRPQASNSSIIPRPSPRATLPQSVPNKCVTKSDNSAVQNANNIDYSNVPNCDKMGKVCDMNVSSPNDKLKPVPKTRSDYNIVSSKTSSTESHAQGYSTSTSDNKPVPSSKSVDSGLQKTFSSSSVPDPFTSTDPFASDDPFTQTDPFANDPFSPDPFSEPSGTCNPPPSDPFTSAVIKPKSPQEESDPFSIFDKTFSSDSFKFDKSSSKKVKLKAAQ